MSEKFIIGVVVIAVLICFMRGGGGRVALMLAVAIGVILAPKLSGLTDTGVDLTQTGAGVVSTVGGAAK